MRRALRVQVCLGRVLEWTGGGAQRGHLGCSLHAANKLGAFLLPSRLHAAVPWTSGAIFSEAEWKAWQQKEVDRLRALDEDPQLPSVRGGPCCCYLCAGPLGIDL